jgi:hypothetical protein
MTKCFYNVLYVPFVLYICKHVYSVFTLINEHVLTVNYANSTGIKRLSKNLLLNCNLNGIVNSVIIKQTTCIRSNTT